MITIRPVPHNGRLLPTGLSGQITGEGDYPGTFRVLLDNGQGTDDDTEIEITSDYFVSTKANAAPG